MSRPRWIDVVALAGGTWLLLDLLRAWTPTLITIFGQAASTPPELIGGFALACMIVPVVLALIGTRRRISHAAASIALAAAVLSRVGLELTDGGRPHLVLASGGVVAAVTWLALVLPRHREAAVTGVVAGLALSVTTHAALGTWGAVWRSDGWAWALLVVQVGCLVPAFTHRGHEEGIGRPLALTLFPGLFLGGVIVANAARASAVADGLGAAATAFGATLAIAATLVPVRRWSAVLAALLLVLAVGVSALVTDGDGLLPVWTVAAFVVGMPALAHVWQAANTGRRGGAVTIAVGGVVWVALLFAYYAGYDLGYRADWLLVAAAAVIGLVGATAAPASGPTARPAVLVGIAGAAVVAGALALVGPAVTIRPLDTRQPSDDQVRVAAYNLRMGYGMDGVFRPREVASVLADADVALVSEIDRGWFLNGGQDQLAILARLTGRTAWFGAAADPVWGDGVLADADRAEVRRHRLPSHGAVTGAQVIAVRPDGPWSSTWFVSTHLQPVDNDEGVTAQAADLAEWMRALDGDVVLGGDFNMREGSAAHGTVTSLGLTDAAPGGAPTSPADRPVKRIDYLFSSPGLTASDVEVPGLEASDHLPVIATFTRR
ncbi:endonuclease/exonuclease/phosphatase family protein [Aeromicrobium duanguangcaii]|uniref:Endonuclease/exonuclease/phosphatase family protein n=1 Tax=Aeromicrobium duanguangcaii TaxID=2968086 RepID=A0ABY5KJ61_9ACTN|nr:endonuclease/exonuclease/phosphatase family protein [Aeromicrobium duanguangcaii]MCD9154551.1 endonuclease/exonuclease/phosphatase family protein [Aeromicrobium duanguangcaii]MCL3838301.1 endonuclease/exonuclease/phosphatase family protein [Aeromicrobium duanguangcaii]UUI68393.1 endonuclease/exonuclease/phosphatase family protein [Aeromicrobium duanguangcaii]